MLKNPFRISFAACASGCGRQLTRPQQRVDRLLTDLLAEGDALLDKERGDVLPDGVQIFAILAEETAVDFLADFLFLHAIEQPVSDALIQVGDQLHIRAAERLMCLVQQMISRSLSSIFSGLFFERLLRCDVDVLQRYVFVCRNFAAGFVLG